MITHNDLIQGSDEWLNYRLKQFNASEASAMLGISKNTTRTELLYFKSTGLSKEFSDYVQRMILDKGHEVEAMARPIVEKLIGEDLYPLVCSEGLYSASCDGLTMDESIAFEHKQWNSAYAEMVMFGELPEEHWPQCQQVLMVTGAQKLIFVVSDGTENNFCFMWVYPDKILQDKLVAGWSQFEKDLVNYQHVEHVEKPKADAIMQLPALVVQIKGEVSLSNLPKFQEEAEAYLSRINKELKTDQDFANAEAQAKDCRSIAKTLELTKNAAIAQTASIDELMRTIDHYKAKFNDVGLSLEKLVKSQKELIKTEIMQKASIAWTNHVNELAVEIKPIRLDVDNPNFGEAVKNKRTLKSLHDSVNTELANAKIKADAVAKSIRVKLSWYRDNASNHAFLFNDIYNIIYKADEDFKLIVETRIAAHKQAESEKLEAQRKRIQEEEQRKAEAEQAKKLEAERAAIREEERINAESEADRIAKESEEKQKVYDALTAKGLEESKPTPADLRASADRIIKSAQYADSSSARNSDLDRSRNMRKQADELESLSFSDKPEIEPTVIEKSEPTITLTVTEHEHLLDRIYWLECLEAAGVDNWTGYHYAQELYQGEQRDKAA